MKVAIISAMESEISSIKENIKNISIEKYRNTQFYIGTYNDNTIIMNTCFEGKVNSAMNTQMLIDKYDVDVVINIGVAGGIDNKVKVGDIVIATQTLQHDYNIEALGYKRGLVLGIDKIYVPCFNDVDISNVHKGIIASGDLFISDKETKNKINKKYNALAVDMESASIAHVCFVNEIKCICVRAISDSDDKMEFRTFLDMAVKKLTKVTLELLEKI